MDFSELISLQNSNSEIDIKDIKKEPLRGDKRERKRHEYKPDLIKYLFIGESVPDGGTFFYYGDSILFKATFEAFKKVFPKLTQATFLDKFKEMGFYLDDLCGEPVNQIKEEKVRKKKRELYEEDLAKRINLFSPKLIITTPVSIFDNVQRAVNASGANIKIYSLPFPVRTQENKNNYMEGWARILNSLTNL